MNIKKELFNIEQTIEIVSLIKDKQKKIAILSHINPDGDALGSSLALSNLLIKSGHICSVISPNDYPEFLKWLPGNERIVIYKHSPQLSMNIIKDADIIFAIDFNEIKRVNEFKSVFEESKAYKILIDHHPAPQINVNYLISDVTASSTAEIVYSFMIETGFSNHIDKDIATCLFVGIMTDTGCFSYNSSNRSTWETVAELLNFGINKDEIYSLVYDNYSENRMRLLGYCLNDKMQIFPEYKTGIISISKNDQLKYKFEPGDSESFVNYPLSIKNIYFSALFTEKDNFVRISFRSKGKFAVNKFAKEYFNGGGHEKAAGGESYISLKDTIERFKDLLIVHKDELCKNEL